MYKYITIGKEELTKDLWKQPKNDYRKPDGGLWACKYTPDKEYISSWVKYYIDEYYLCNRRRTDTAVLFNISDNARIYTIDNLRDLDLLIETYRDPNNHRSVLDFEKLSERYDVIELTEEGQLKTRMSYPNNLYSWDVECILILNFDIITEQEQLKIDSEEE